MYSPEVLDHFQSPRNVGEMPDADGIGEAGNPISGNTMKLYLKIKENSITDAKFQTFGCCSAVASASALTEMIIGKTLDEVAKITNRDIADFFGGLPAEKMHCSVMGQEALEAAIQQYRGVSDEEAASRKKQVVCECFGVTSDEIERVVRENSLKRIEDVTNYTKAGGGCHQCHGRIQEILDMVSPDAEPVEPRPVAVKLTNIQKMKLIEETFEKEIRPMLKADGGDIELIDVDGDRVVVSLRGMWSSCSSSSLTLKKHIEPKLKEFVSPDLYLEEVKP